MRKVSEQLDNFCGRLSGFEVVDVKVIVRSYRDADELIGDLCLLDDVIK